MNRIMATGLTVLLGAGLSLTAFAEERLVRDRQSEIHNEEMRRAVAADREAAQRAHEAEMAKLKEQDAKRLAEKAAMKERYQQVQEEREAIAAAAPSQRDQVRTQQKQNRERKESGKPEEKQKTK